jgi:hypothetical protein
MTMMTLTPYGAGRVYGSSYQGKRARLCLAVNPGTLGPTSTTAQWDAVELSGNGYARYEWTIPAGSYNTTTGQFEAPSEVCPFQASAQGVGLTWNTAYLVLGTISNNVTTWNTGVEMLFVESANVAIYPGQPQAYEVSIFVRSSLTAS